MLDLMESIVKREMAIRLTCREERFDSPLVRFVMTKVVQGKEKYIIGINDQEKNYIFFPYGQRRKIRETDIHYKKIYRDLFDECIEGYILLSLNHGYELKYMDVEFHCRLWDFIDSYLDEMEYISQGLYAYLSFCKLTGINHSLLEYQSSYLFNDILTLFTESYFGDYSILISEKIGARKILLSYQKRESEQEDIYIYKVLVIEMPNQRVEYCDYHSEIENALADYNNHFFALSFQYYQNKEASNKSIISDFAHLIKRGETE